MIGALAAVLPAAYNLITGISQQVKGKKALRNLERPSYEIPKDLQTSLALAQSNYADPRFTGQAQAENRIGQNMANAVQNTMDFGGNPMDNIAAIQGQSNAAYQSVAEEQARQQQADLANLQSMSQVMANAKDTQWQMNEFAPYAQKYNEGREQIGAGQTNVATGLGGLANIGTALLSQLDGKKTPTPNLGSVVNTSQMAQDAATTAAGTSQMGGIIDSIVKMYLQQGQKSANAYLGSGIPFRVK